MSEHIVELEVGDVLIDTWQSFRIEHDFASPADSFDMTFGVSAWDPTVDAEPIALRLRGYSKARAPVEIRIDGAKQLRGFIDGVTGGGDGSGSSVRVRGRDVGGQVVDEPMPRGFNVVGITVLEALTAVLSKYGIAVIVGNDLNRELITKVTKSYTVEASEAEQKLFKQKWFKKVKAPFDFEEIEGSSYVTAYYAGVSSRRIAAALKVRGNDTRWSWISRLLKTQNVMGWFSADGTFVVGMPDYGQVPIFHATRVVQVQGQPLPAGRSPNENNIESGEYTESPGQRYSTAYVFGRQGLDPIRGEAHDTELEALGVDRPVYKRDGKIRTIEEADRVAQRILDDGRIKGTVYECKLAGFSQGNRLYAFDTTWDVWDDDPGSYVHDIMYCTRVVREYDTDSGPTTRVTLQPRGCIEVP